jgi:hypothetical protein
MKTMANQPNWGKQAVVAAWVIGAPSFFLALVAYLRLPDPAHPIHFGFIYNTISISVPLWFLILLVIAIIAGVLLLLRAWPGRVLALVIPPGKLPRLANTRALDSANALKGPADIPLVSDNAELTITSRDDISVRITPNEWQHMKGYVISVVNRRLGAVGRVKLTVYSARSFDKRQCDYRDGRDFNAFAKIIPDPIDASRSSKPIWFVRKDRGEMLLVGEDSDHPLRWPGEDTSTVQQWRLTIAIDAQTVPIDSSQAPTVLGQMKMLLVLTWNKATNEFSIAEETESGENRTAGATGSLAAVVPADPRLSVSVIEDAKHGLFRSGFAIVIKNVGGSEAQQISLAEITIGSHKVTFPAKIPVLNPGDSTPPISGRIHDYGVVQQHDVARAMLDAWNDRRDANIKHMSFSASASYSD